MYVCMYLCMYRRKQIPKKCIFVVPRYGIRKDLVATFRLYFQSHLRANELIETVNSVIKDVTKASDVKLIDFSQDN